VRLRELLVAHQDLVIEDAFVAMVDLQLALGMVDVARAEDVLEEELLRALAKVLELGGGEAERGRVDAGDVAVETASGAGFDEQLKLAMELRVASCGLPGLYVQAGKPGQLATRNRAHIARGPQHLAETVARGVGKMHVQ
jgi:hypothetical protein